MSRVCNRNPVLGKKVQGHTGPLDFRIGHIITENCLQWRWVLTVWLWDFPSAAAQQTCAWVFRSLQRHAVIAILGCSDRMLVYILVAIPAQTFLLTVGFQSWYWLCTTFSCRRPAGLATTAGRSTSVHSLTLTGSNSLATLGKRGHHCTQK